MLPGSLRASSWGSCRLKPAPCWTLLSCPLTADLASAGGGRGRPPPRSGQCPPLDVAGSLKIENHHVPPRPAPATLALGKLTPGKEVKPAGPLGEGRGRARRARSSSRVFPVAGHPLLLTSPGAGGAGCGAECAGRKPKKNGGFGLASSGWIESKRYWIAIPPREEFFF